ncbi:Zn-dependent exopeptidase [Xylariaceae sp. FL0255]|nr:Zn-dependent exopeptidase [Xylariaceae sp. FL0255]
MKLSRHVALLSVASISAASQLQQPLSPPSEFKSSVQPRPLPDSHAPGYRKDLLSLHKSLIDISSITGTENAVGNFLVDYLTERQFRAELQFLPPTIADKSFAKPRFNVLAWPGSRLHPSPKVLVSSHIDTVPPFIPYSRSDQEPTSDTIIAGRGSVDAKASVAAQVIAVLELLQRKSIDPEDVMLLFVVGEERSGDGMRHFSDTLAALDPPPSFKAAIFGEPTEGKLACGHKGFFGCTVTAHGHAGHSGYPWLGKSATEVLMRGLVKILDTDLGSTDDFGNTTINVGLIEGGVAPNVIPETAWARIAGRVAIGPELDGGKKIIERVKETLQGIDKDAFELDCVNGYGVVRCECDAEGFESITVNYGTDVPNFKGNHTRYLYGPGTILVAHGPDEAIKVKDLEAGVEGFKKLILHAVKN